MGIQIIVGVMVMSAVNRGPMGGRELQRAGADDGERALNPSSALEGTMRDQAVIGQIDANDAKDESAHIKENDAGPAEKPGKYRQNCHGVAKCETDRFPIFYADDATSLAEGCNLHINPLCDPGRGD
jgi:hypothetical protein